MIQILYESSGDITLIKHMVDYMKSKSTIHLRSLNLRMKLES